MKIYKSSLMALTALMALAVSSCSESPLVDDVNVVGEPTAGAFFTQGATATLSVVEEQNNFLLDLGRTDASAEATVALTIAWPEADGQELQEMFYNNFPTSVTFPAGQANTTLQIPYDATKIPFGTDAVFTVTLDPAAASPYGAGQVAVTVSKIKWGAWEKDSFEAFYYFGAFSGGDYFEMYRRSSVIDANDFQIDVEGMWSGLGYEDADIPGGKDNDYYMFTYNTESGQADFPLAESPDVFGSGYTTYYGSVSNIYRELLGRTIDNDCFFDAAAGRFDMTTAFCYPHDGSVSWTGAVSDYIQLPGYGDYSCQIEYGGLYAGDDGVLNAIVKTQTTEDPAFNLVGIVKAADEDELITHLMAILNGQAEATKVENGEQTTLCPIQGNGHYYAFIMTFKNTDEGPEQMDYNYVDFNVNLASAAPARTIFATNLNEANLHSFQGLKAHRTLLPRADKVMQAIRKGTFKAKRLR